LVFTPDYQPAYRWIAPIYTNNRCESKRRNHRAFIPAEPAIAPTLWAGIERIATTNDHAFLYKSALSAIIVPKRSFPAPARFDELIAKGKKLPWESLTHVLNCAHNS
jgi:hypothetical protein